MLFSFIFIIDRFQILYIRVVYSSSFNSLSISWKCYLYIAIILFLSLVIDLSLCFMWGNWYFHSYHLVYFLVSANLFLPFLPFCIWQSFLFRLSLLSPLRSLIAIFSKHYPNLLLSLISVNYCLQNLSSFSMFSFLQSNPSILLYQFSVYNNNFLFFFTLFLHQCSLFSL